MKENILIVEDNPTELLMIREDIQKVSDGATCILQAECANEAIEIAKRGDIAYCVLDLGLPAQRGGPIIGVEKKCHLGIEVLKAVLDNNSHAVVRILSRHTDIRAIYERVNQETEHYSSRIFDVNNKQRDLKLNDESKLAWAENDLLGMHQMSPVFERMGIRVIHPLERRLARKLWQVADMKWSKKFRPIIVMRGEPRTGKDRWGEALAGFRDVRQPCNPSEGRPKLEGFNLGLLSQHGDGALTELFGTLNYPDSENAGGVFERATTYLQGNVRAHDQNDTHGRIIWKSCQFVLLTELGNLSLAHQQLLLDVTDSNENAGFVARRGTGEMRNRLKPIGCGFIFTTNAALEDRVAKSDSALEGQIREDFFERLNQNEWLRVPSFLDMGWSAFEAHLNAAFAAAGRKDCELAPATEQRLKDFFASGSLTHDSIQKIVRAVTASRASRVTHSHILALDTRRPAERHTSAVTMPSVDRQPSAKFWDIETMLQNKVIRPKTKSFFLLKLLLERIGDAVPDDEVVGYMNANLPNVKPTAGRALTPIETGDLRHCMSRLRVRLKEFPAAKIVIAEYECRAAVTK